MFCFVFIDVTGNYNYAYVTSIKTKQTPRSWAAYDLLGYQLILCRILLNNTPVTYAAQCIPKHNYDLDLIIIYNKFSLFTKLHSLKILFKTIYM